MEAGTVTPDITKLLGAIRDLRSSVGYIEHDCSPHAPEIPFTVKEDLDALFAIAAEIEGSALL